MRSLNSICKSIWQSMWHSCDVTNSHEWHIHNVDQNVIRIIRQILALKWLVTSWLHYEVTITDIFGHLNLAKNINFTVTLHLKNLNISQDIFVIKHFKLHEKGEKLYSKAFFHLILHHSITKIIYLKYIF